MGGLNISSSMDNWGMVDNRSNMAIVSNWVSNKSMVGKRMGNKSMVGNWVGNKSMVGNWVGNKSMVGYWVGNKPMVGCAMRDNSTMSMDNLVGRHSRGGGGGSKAKKSRNNESLHFCSILVLQLIPC